MFIKVRKIKMTVQITEFFDGNTIYETQVAHLQSALDVMVTQAHDHGWPVSPTWTYTPHDNDVIVDFGSHLYFGRIVGDRKAVEEAFAIKNKEN